MKVLLVLFSAPFLTVGFLLFCLVRLIVFSVVGFLTVAQEYMYFLDTVQAFALWRREN